MKYVTPSPLLKLPLSSNISQIKCLLHLCSAETKEWQEKYQRRQKVPPPLGLSVAKGSNPTKQQLLTKSAAQMI